MIRTFVFIAVLLSGCASSRLPASPPATLTEVNRVLEDRQVTVVLIDGQIFEVADVEIGETETTYHDQQTRLMSTVPTDSLDHVHAQTSSGAGRGFLAGVTPGLIVTGMGLHAVSNISEHSTGIGESLIVMTGATLAATGALVGTVVGATASPPEWRGLYRGERSRI